MNKQKINAIFYAVLAAVFYALNTPLSKAFLQNVSSTMMAAFLYIGAGTGIGILYVFHRPTEAPSERLSKQDLPYTLGMIGLDILAPILLMIGLRMGSASNAALLGNFEIVATAVLAKLIFKEKVSRKLWIAIALITLSSFLLTLEDTGDFRISLGSLFVLLATCCWGLENNCTKNLSQKSAYEIVTLKGLCSGFGSLLIALIAGEALPELSMIVSVMLLGFVAYGLSIFLYVKAQRDLGAARTGAYYAIAPFVSAFLCVLIHHDTLSGKYFMALFIMIAGSVLTAMDTLEQQVA